LVASGPKGSEASSKKRIVLGELVLDRLRHEVRMGSDELQFTRKEFALLWTLATEPGRVFHRDELLAKIWGRDVVVEPRTIDAHITSVRRKLRRYRDTYRIDTIWGIGYRLKEPS
jgi:DNA-binding response OmpR family regulator